MERLSERSASIPRSVLLMAVFHEKGLHLPFGSAAAFTLAPVCNYWKQPSVSEVQSLHRHGRPASTARLFANEFHDVAHGKGPLLSEMDAIKILRARPRRIEKHTGENITVTTTSCTTAHQVLQVLHYSTSHLNETPLVEVVVNEINPNVAAAALRRLVSPPFLPSSFSTTKRGIRYLNNKQPIHHGEVTEQEKGLYIQLTTLLQKKLYDCMTVQVDTLSSFAKNDDSSPMLIPKNSTLDYIPIYSKSSTLNWYAMADILFSASVISNIQVYRSTNRKMAPSRNVYLKSISEKESLFDEESTTMFDMAVQFLSYNNVITSSFVRCIGPKRIVRDVLLPLVIVEAARKRSHNFHTVEDSMLEFDEEEEEEHFDIFDDHGDPLTKNINHMLHVMSSYLSLPHSLEVLNCDDLSTTLWCIAQIYDEPIISGSQWPEEVHINLIRSFMKRLRKVSIHSMGSGIDISKAIWSVDRLVKVLEQREPSYHVNESWQLDGIDLPSEVIFPGEGDNQPIIDKVMSKSMPIRDEATIMFYTLQCELLKCTSSSSDYCKMNVLDLGQIADILCAAISLEVPISDLTSLIKTTINVLTSSKSTTNQCNSYGTLSRILWSLQRLRVGSGQFQDLQTEAYCVETIGERFLALIRDQKTPWQCSPKQLVTSLRATVMMFPRRPNAILEAASYLILASDNGDMAEPDLYNSSPFLTECNEFEVSNLLFSYALAGHFDEDVYFELTATMLEADIIQSCTPSSASRAMWACAVLIQLIPSNSDESVFYERQVDLFHQLSGILLMTSNLSSSDCSGAMWSMAKTGYALDKGCFDYLAKRLSSILEHSNTRTVAQAVWACAKMIRYEKFASEIDSQPPYLDSVVLFFGYLIDHGEQMTPLHISQTIWSLGVFYARGSLKDADPALARDLSSIAMQNVDHFNTQEIANIVWAFSKVDFSDAAIITRLIRHVTTSSKLSEACTSQEASNMIYALGKMHIRESVLFNELSLILMNQLQGASSQAIANALWAYDAVALEPPIELMGCWAREKLGMDAFSSVTGEKEKTE
eukprot:scaffold41844_cov46-Cyclotella_meneghiniana.AAC.3